MHSRYSLSIKYDCCGDGVDSINDVLFSLPSRMRGSGARDLVSLGVLALALVVLILPPAQVCVLMPCLFKYDRYNTLCSCTCSL